MKAQRKYIIIAVTFSALLSLPVIFHEQIGDALDNWKDIQKAQSFNIESKPELYQFEQELDLTSKGKTIFRASTPALLSADEFNTTCPSEIREIFLLGCFDESKRTLAVYQVVGVGLNGIIESTLAHEFLHAAWSRLKEDEKSKLETFLLVEMDKNSGLADELDIYSDEQKISELHSRVGAETKSISNELETHYAKYFNDRAHIVTYYEQYKSKFDELKAAQEKLTEQMTALKSEINTLEEKYYALLNDYNSLLRTYETATLSPANYEYSELEAMYNNLNGMMNTMNGYVNEVNAKIDKYNSLTEEYNSLGLDLEDLYDKVNSKVEEL